MAGALIAGGASSRFGQDKARLPWGQGSLGGHLLGQMQKAGLSPLLLNAAEPLPGMPALTRVIPDEQPGQGPLQGLAAILRVSTQPVLVAACDMPGLSTAAFQALAEAWRPDLKGLVARSEDGWQPLFAIYSPALLPEVDRRLARGQRALHLLVEDEGLAAWTAADLAWLVNVNTLTEWDAWKARQAGSERP